MIGRIVLLHKWDRGRPQAFAHPQKRDRFVGTGQLNKKRAIACSGVAIQEVVFAFPKGTTRLFAHDVIAPQFLKSPSGAPLAFITIRTTTFILL